MSALGTIVAEGGWPAPVAACACLAVLPWARRDSTWMRAGLVTVTLALMVRYLAWRWSSSLPPMGATWNYACGLTFVAFETAAMVGAMVSLGFLSRIKDRKAEVAANLPWLASLPVIPLVDVLVCTYDEEAAILERTIVGALAMDYPNFRVWVCDDTRRPWLKDLSERLGCGYLTRPDNSHAKAGNINAALASLSRLARKPEFVSVLDADFVPMPDFLTRAMSLFREDDVGVVQTPQHFINPDPMQANLALSGVWPDEQRYFFDVIMASKDAWGAAFCCGTSSVLRFAPLLAIGGFPTESVTEDYLVTLKLRQAGFRTVYLNERLSLGLAPEGLKEYITQRSRWCLGFVQICMGRNGPLVPGNGLRLVDRLILTETFLHWSAAHAYRILGFFVPIAYLLFGIEAVHADATDALVHFTPYFVMQVCVVCWMSNWRTLPVLNDVAQVLGAYDIVKAVWAGLTKPKGQKFKVTAKGGDRSKTTVQWALMSRFAVILALTAAGIFVTFQVGSGNDVRESAAVALFWCWYNALVLVVAMYVCVERPRPRNGERLPSRETVTVSGPSGVRRGRLLDVSVTGMRFQGASQDRVGARVSVAYNDETIGGHVVRATPNDHALALDKDDATRRKMIRAIYSGRYDADVGQVSPRKVAIGLLARAWA